MKKLLYRIFVRRKLMSADAVKNLLAKYVDRIDIESYQVKRFNAIWEDARKNIPFYRKWQKDFSLPNVIANLGELQNWPVLTKRDLQDVDSFYRNGCSVPKQWLVTGGSTGEPIRLPQWSDWISGVSQIVGRGRYGVLPGDRIFLLWGHEHLYGKGVRRRVNIFKRRVKDWISNWRRVSAYDLSSKAMIEAYRKFASFRPKGIIGFSPAVLAFVRQNYDKRSNINGVETVICTAGPLSESEKAEIESFFHAKVCMEYGSVECGVMAYTRPKDGWYDVFWNTHLLQAQKQFDGEFKNLVTRLTDCYVPLIRYDIGDYLELNTAGETENACSVIDFRYVKGRPSEMINFACGVSFFGALIGDCVKQVPEVVSSQIAVDECSDKLEIRVTAKEVLSADKLSLVKNRFELTVADARKLNINVVQVVNLYTTVGGKIPRVVRI